MDKLFIPAKTKSKLNTKIFLKEAEKLPKNILLAYSIQFQDLAFQIKKILKKNIVAVFQVLGCSKIKIPKKTQAILLIGSGKFHATSLILESKIPVYLFEGNKINKISSKDLEKLNQTKKTAKLKFFNAEKVGVLISTKPGQQKLNSALEIKSKFKNKNFYFFISNNISPIEFENFQINSFVNTACPRLDMDKSVINISDLEN